MSAGENRCPLRPQTALRAKCNFARKCGPKLELGTEEKDALRILRATDSRLEPDGGAGIFHRMSTLTEIEQAIATLPAPEQRELYRHLGARLGSSAAPAADRRKAVTRFLQRWTGAGTAPVTEEDLQAQRTARLLEKQVK